MDNHQFAKKSLSNKDKENVKPINKNLVGAKKNILSLSVKSSTPSTANFTNDSTLTNNERKTLSNSFDKLLKLIVTPTDNECHMIFRKNKENLQTNSSKDNTTQDVKPTFRKNSFELMMDSLLNPVNNNKAFLSSQSDGEKCKDMTFDEMMNKILTPDLNPPNQQKNRDKLQPLRQTSINEKCKNKKQKNESASGQQRECCIQMSARNEESFSQPIASTLGDADISFDKLLFQYSKVQEKERVDWAREKKNPVKEKSQSFFQLTVSTLGDADISFEQLLSQAFSQHSKVEEKKRADLAKEEETPVNEKSSTPETYKPSENSSLTETQQSVSIFANADDTSDYQVSTPELTSRDEGTNLKKENPFRDTSTQTSFNDSFMPVSSTAWLSHLENPPFSPSQTILDIQPSKKANIATDLCDEDSAVADITENREHMLNILSRDFTFLPDGRKIFNISQIGTDKWLDSAFAIAKKRKRCNTKEKFEVKEEQNTSSLYIDYVTKTEIKRYLEGKTKVCQIKKSDGRETESLGTKTEQTHFWNDVGPELSSFSTVQRRIRQGIDQICNDARFVSSNCSLQKIDKGKICIKVHNIFAKLYEAFENNQSPVLVLRKNGCAFKNRRLQSRPLKEAPLKRVTSKNFTFCRLLYVLGKTYSLLQSKTKLTKREIFYQIKHLVTKQTFVDKTIEEATRLLGVGHWHLNITCQTGLVYGDLKLFWASGEVTDCNSPATSVPCDMEDIVEIQTNASFILVVEKESIFRKLLEEDLPNKLARPFIMVTGKGVPGINTRLFLNKISKMMALPVFIFVDADVYGIRIMLNYRFGTTNNSHLADDLTVPNALWLGVFPSEISTYGMTSQHLTRRDKSIINSVLQYPCMEEHPRIAAELEVLLNLKKKASIEGLLKNDTFLSESYLPMKFFNQNFI